MAGYELVTAAVILALLIAAAVVYAYMNREVLDPAGKNAPGKTRGILKRYAMPRGFKALSNLRLETKEGAVTAENVLIGFFGILIVRTCGQRGEFYGEMDGAQWTLVQEKQGKSQIPNPYLENEKVIRAIRPLLAKNKINGVHFENQVVFTSASKATQLFIPHSDGIILGGKLSKHLARARFDEDKGVDVEKIAAVLEPFCEPV